MIPGLKQKEPVDSSLSITAISLGGIGVLAPKLAMQFERHLSDIISDSGKLLRTLLQNKIAVARPVFKRNNYWFFNKLYRCLNIDSGYIELSGTELLAVSKLLNKETGLKVYPQNTYLVPFAEAEKMLSELDLVARNG